MNPKKLAELNCREGAISAAAVLPSVSNRSIISDSNNNINHSINHSNRYNRRTIQQTSELR